MNLYPDNLDFTQMGETVDMHGIQYIAFSQPVWEQIDKTIRELHATCENETKWASHYLKRSEELGRQLSQWVEASDASQQPQAFYDGYSEAQMRAMQAMLTTARKEAAMFREALLNHNSK